MSLLKFLNVSGANYKLSDRPSYDASIGGYTAYVEHADGRRQRVYSRYPEGPFVFTIPTPENNQ